MMTTMFIDAQDQTRPPRLSHPIGHADFTMDNSNSHMNIDMDIPSLQYNRSSPPPPPYRPLLHNSTATRPPSLQHTTASIQREPLNLHHTADDVIDPAASANCQSAEHSYNLPLQQPPHRYVLCCSVDTGT